ncbi:hypothetical protein M3J09_004331 [Ascochyta lentis]
MLLYLEWALSWGGGPIPRPLPKPLRGADRSRHFAQYNGVRLMGTRSNGLARRSPLWARIEASNTRNPCPGAASTAGRGIVLLHRWLLKVSCRSTVAPSSCGRNFALLPFGLCIQ